MDFLLNDADGLRTLFLERIEGFYDHAPILMTTRGPSRHTNYRFKFELGWLERTGFHDMVKGVWKRPTRAGSLIQRWNTKMWSLRSHLSGWAKHESGVLKNKKQRLTVIVNNLEALAEVRPLSP
jgi:hypothetical protein